MSLIGSTDSEAPMTGKREGSAADDDGRLHAGWTRAADPLEEARGLLGTLEARIAVLWREAVTKEDPSVSERLVALSHALRRAELALLAQAIGLPDRSGRPIRAALSIASQPDAERLSGSEPA